MSTLDTLALGCAAIAYIPYCIGIWFQGKRPNPIAWLVFLMVNSAILFSQVMTGHIAIPVVVFECGMIVVLISAWLTTKPEWNTREKQLFAAAVTALALYFITGPILAILLSLTAMFFGSVPMFEHLYADPDAEPRTPWLLFWSSSVCEFFANGWPHEEAQWVALLPIIGFFIQQSIVLGLGLRPKPVTV